ncbi:ACT domain-containing protein [Thiovibrio frasassiensis]|uniref:ACT domain-containing protein n=1 Tax=Thiovibrio frasassiensis TaxID=2984131 RepID=A0A9X4MCG5_9BACT|nr:ACT domain-containing protein [Thiovibrio frasassiensis]MDG4475004.1 ACT domain-containing protein [Thiovibrio frasassiensis]
MKVKQLEIFLKNNPGRLADISHTLAENAINIRALSVADTADSGILRLVVNDTTKAQQVLQENGFTVALTDVLAVEVPDKPGTLDCILQVARKGGLNVEYMYAFSKKSGESGMLLFRFDDQDAAVALFQKAGCRLLSDDEIHSL